MTEPTTDPTTPTQVSHPWRAALRTFLQAWLPALVLLVGILPEAVNIILEETATFLPDSLRGVMLAISVGAAALSAIIARIMALQSVNRLLQTTPLLAWLAPRPASEEQMGA